MYNEHLHFKDGEGETLRGSPPAFQKLHNYSKQSQDWTRGSDWPPQVPGQWADVWAQGRRLQTRAAACSVSEILLGHRHLLAAGRPGLLLCYNAGGELWPQQTNICSLAHQALFVEPWPGGGDEAGQVAGSRGCPLGLGLRKGGWCGA